MFNNELWQKPTAAGATDFYTHQIANSCRFDSASSSYLTRSAGTPSNANIATFSCWIKRGNLANMGESSGSPQCIVAGGNEMYEFYDGAHDDKIKWTGGNGGDYITTGEVYRDPSAWYNLVFRYDSTGSTASEYVRIYKNGTLIDPTTYTEQSYSAQNEATKIGQSSPVRLGNEGTGSEDNFFDGYMAEVVFCDGQSLDASSFGETKNGVWIPKDPSGLTFGTNGFWLKFSNSANLGEDFSGNDNDFTSSGLSADHQTGDTPTFNSSSNGGNFATLGPLWKTDSVSFSEGNLKATSTTNNVGAMSNWQVPLTGKWYWEVIPTFATDHAGYIGVMPANTDLTINQESNNLGLVYYSANGNSILKGTRSSYGATFTSGDVIGVAVDRSADTIQFYKNGSAQGSAIDVSSLNSEFFPYLGFTGGTSTQIMNFNFGQDGTFAGETTAGDNADANGYGNFKQTVPTDYKAICLANFPTPAADPASEEGPAKYFTNKLYTGDGGSTLAITGLEFQPDFTWIKNRDQADDHCLFDSTRGVTKLITSNSEAAETTDADTLKSWTSDGFTVGADVKVNTSSEKYVSWNWKANGGTTSSNSDGSITSTVQVDADRGFSIIKYTGSGSGAITYGHGLSAAPEFIVNWRLEASQSRTVYHHLMNDGGAPADQGRIYLDATSTYDTGSGGLWDVSAITSSTIGCVSGTWMNQSEDFLTLAFVGKEGFSKFSYYKGNGNADGTFVYTGFRPAYVMIKSTDVADSWFILDDVRDIDNEAIEYLQANSSAEGLNHSNIGIDILSNGFKCRRSSNALNGDGNDYVYVAFAKNPFKYATAR